MAEKVVKNETEEEARREIYELGYLLAPSIPEGELAQEVVGLKGLIEKLGGIFLSEEHPTLMPLAYTVNLVRTGRREKYQDAYFGSLKFELAPSVTASLKEGLEHQEHLVRYLLVTTVKEDTRAPKRLFQKSESAPSGRPAVRFADKEKAKTPVSEEELDRSLASVVVE
jgi:ribosomal protein S6